MSVVYQHLSLRRFVHGHWKFDHGDIWRTDPKFTSGFAFPTFLLSIPSHLAEKGEKTEPLLLAVAAVEAIIASLRLLHSIA